MQPCLRLVVVACAAPDLPTPVSDADELLDRRTSAEAQRATRFSHASITIAYLRLDLRTLHRLRMRGLVLSSFRSPSLSALVGTTTARGATPTRRGQ